ncbi:DUF1611 domain-containing protein [Halapricum salinum]|uniref:DUF1611 domain-containing protein n=1 Tax=Halapricum salinum TaxID=1457250 RepID=A0A4D6HB99_9EURY|nr:DUF1611 domain-containing protein [Halapricum salinum]QCC50438.1 DUF1611 domain-containing protein [Halapricum salinum]
MRVAILAHEQFPERAKTAVGVLRYGDQEVVAVLDRDRAGDSIREYLDEPRIPNAPIVAGVEDAPEFDALIVGIAPIGGGFEASWRPDVRGALERGCDVYAGLHYQLNEDEEFARLAAEHDCELVDVRDPPDDLTVSEARAREVDATVVLAVGTDCSTGKMTAAMELREAAREEGLDAAVVPTGQTGILIEGWGIAVDRTISDFTAGAVERMVQAVGDHDVVFVEGQGALAHPAYSAVTAGIVHGSMPEKLVLCHEAGRQAVHGYESFSLPPAEEYAALYERFADPVAESAVAAGMLNTSGIDDDQQAREAIESYAEAIDAPATDPIRFEASAVLDTLV